MESVLSINGLAQIIDFIGVPVLLGAAMLATLLLTGVAERIMNIVDAGSLPVPLRRRPSREME